MVETSEVTERRERLRKEFERADLAYREFDYLHDHVQENAPRRFSEEAHQKVLEGIAQRRDAAKGHRDYIGALLKELEGVRS